VRNIYFLFDFIMGGLLSRDGQAPSREKLSNALQEARGNVNGAAPSFYFDIKPHSHQQTIL
jgi:hypothetical protein